jgi:hypothetical protein
MEAVMKRYIETVASCEIDLEYGVAFDIDYVASGYLWENSDGDPSAGYVHRYTEVTDVSVSITSVTIKGDRNKTNIMGLLEPSIINHLSEALLESAESDLEDAA